MGKGKKNYTSHEFRSIALNTEKASGFPPFQPHQCLSKNKVFYLMVIFKNICGQPKCILNF